MRVLGSTKATRVWGQVCRCVALRLSRTRTGELLGDLAAAYDRLVNACVSDPAERLRQGRFIGMLIAGPVPVAVSIAIMFPPQIGPTAMLAGICATFCLGWLMAVVAASTGKTRLLEIVALTAATGALAAIVAAAGGLASPAALAVAALPLEAWWLYRSSRAALTGAAAALAVIPAQILVTQAFSFHAVAGAAGWLVPLAYAAFLAPRLAAWLDEAASGNAAPSARPLDEIIDAVVLKVTASGEVLDASPQARRIFGVTPELLLANGFFERIHVADRVAYMCAVADMRQGKERKSVALRFRVPGEGGAGTAPDYRPFLIDMTGQPGGQPIVMVARCNDDMVQLREGLAAATDKAQTLDVAKNRFLAAVSHELRTPLNAIIGFSDMLLHEMFGPFGDPRQKEYVGLVAESGHHLLAVVNSILDVSRIEAGTYSTRPEPFRFRDAVDMCHSMLKQQAAAKHIELTVNVAPETGTLEADKRAVQQILINLVANAIKFTPKGGRVETGAKRIGSRVHFWVSDTGIGISEDDLPLLGKPFMQVQNDYTRHFEGAGLGLSLVTGLVSLHHGTMVIESALGEGTKVTISLPAERSASGKPAADTGTVVLPPKSIAKEDINGTLRKTG